jgi:hypothetical protein
VAIKFQPGALFRVPAGEGYGYGVMLSEFPYMAFYGKDVEFDESGDASREPLFVAMVIKGAFSTGRWGIPIRILGESVIVRIPLFFSQSVTNKREITIVDHVARRRVKATPQECLGLEREAVWSPEHIEARLEDYYAGRPNIFAESLKPKL